MTDTDRLLGAFEGLAAEVSVRLADLDPAKPVPPCPGWSVADLVAHLGETHLWAEHAVRVGDPDAPELEVPGGGGAALAAWYRDAAGRLLATLRSTSPDAPCWTFGPRPRQASFWSRRQLHELAVHRWDLGTTGGDDPDYPAGLAADGVDEVVTMFFPRQVRLGRIPPLPRRVRLRADDGEEWVLHGDGVGGWAGTVDATVSGPADALVLLLWGRLGLDDPRLMVTGARPAAEQVLRAGLVP